MIESIKERFMVYSDSQRLDRLRKCEELHTLLQACISRRQPSSDTTGNASTVTKLEDTPTGMKMMRYFEWRTNELMRVTDEHGETRVVAVPNQSETSDDSCAREAHALWACRAVTLACASKLNQLKECFDTLPKEQIISVTETAYEVGVAEGATVPCRMMQQQLGECVGIRAAELKERIRARQPEQEEV